MAVTNEDVAPTTMEVGTAGECWVRCGAVGVWRARCNGDAGDGRGGGRYLKKSGALFKTVEEKLKIQNLVCDFATVAPLDDLGRGALYRVRDIADACARAPSLCLADHSITFS